MIQTEILGYKVQLLERRLDQARAAYTRDTAMLKAARAALETAQESEDNALIEMDRAFAGAARNPKPCRCRACTDC